MENPTPFVHLRLHSEYSLVDGLVRLKPLVKTVAAAGMPAVAVTDQNNLFGLVKFYGAAQGAGVKPIAGVDFLLEDPDDPTQPWLLTLLCKDNDGYRNLSEIVSRCYTEGQKHGRPMLKRQWLEGQSDGLIALSGARLGDVGQALLAGKRDLAAERLTHWLRLFGDNYYLEVQRTGRAGEEEYLHAAVQLAALMGVPVVATNDVRFLTKEEFEAHEARVCIHESRTLDDLRRPHNYSEEQYLKTPEEMAELFADLPEALENTVEIARRCNLTLQLGTYYLPDFPIPAGMTIDEYFRKASEEGLEARLTKLFDRSAPDFAEKRKPYDERLKIELDVICQMGFPGYFLIVADFIQWGKNNGVPVGPGRGSGAGSLVAYALTITDLDPLEYDLLFERFLNPERVSMPDFDVDFCMEGRDRVIDYVAEKYGREKVSQIITYGTMAAKAVVRDVGRVMGHPYGMVDGIAKLIPFELGITLEKALEQEEDLRKRYENDEDVHDLIDMARSLEGITRNAGKHAGGVVIAPTKLTDFAPLYCEAGGQGVVTQFDKNDVESVGLVKFDFLGLRTLTIIDWALHNIKGATGEEVDIAAIPLNDKKSFDLLKACQTTAVFQLESRGMKDLIKRLQPDCFEDIVALVALFRPGPLQSGMVDNFINRKHGRESISYPDAQYQHESLKPILQPTYGIILYQEQVMQIAQVLAGYTLGGADMLRRAMGKKKPEEMEKQRSVFAEGAANNGIDPDLAMKIFDLVEKFAGYGFNKTLSPSTEILTTTGIKAIKDCRAGDVVLTFNQDGTLVHSNVVALHDHGLVPLWEITFDDGTKEECTLDHKWLTRHGQLPLWAIIQMDEQVWGTASHQACDARPSEGVSPLSRHDPLRADLGEALPHALWRGGADAGQGERAFSKLFGLSGAASRRAGAGVQDAGTHAADAPALCGDREEDLRPARHPAGARRAAQGLAGGESRALRRHSGEGSCLAQAFQDGGVACATLEHQGVQPQRAVELRWGAQAGGFRSPARWHRDRSGWTLALPADPFGSVAGQGAAAGPDAGARDPEAILALNPALDGVFQKQLWRTYLAQPRSAVSADRRWDMGRDTVLRKPVRATFLGWHQGYDLEVDHPEHNFLLASGLCCSNSHSAAYALVSYQTAWLKAHYPAAFMAAVLSADMDNTDKVVTLIDECAAMGLKVVPPSVNTSAYKFTVREDGAVVYGLGAIKGVGEGAIAAIVEENQANGPFKDLFDFCNRIDLKKANRRVLESLIRAGALDGLGPNRATMTAALPQALQIAEKHAKDAQVGMSDLFGFDAAVLDESPATYEPVPEWEEQYRLQGEKETLGLYLTGHPINPFLAELGKFTSCRIVDLKPTKKQTVVVAGLIIAMRTMNTKKGDRIAFVTLDDRSARIEIAVFTEAYNRFREMLVKDRLIVVSGEVSVDEYSGGYKMQANEIYDIDQARERFAKRLVVEVDGAAMAPGFVAELGEVLEPFVGGRCPVRVVYRNLVAECAVDFGEAFGVRPGEELVRRLGEVVKGVAVEYG